MVSRDRTNYITKLLLKQIQFSNSLVRDGLNWRLINYYSVLRRSAAKWFFNKDANTRLKSSKSNYGKKLSRYLVRLLRLRIFESYLKRSKTLWFITVKRLPNRYLSQEKTGSNSSIML